MIPEKLLPIGATFQDKHLGWFKVVGHIPNGYGQLVEDVEPCETPIKLQEPKEMKPTPTAAPVRFKWPKIKKTHFKVTTIAYWSSREKLEILVRKLTI